jgi:Bacterial PH domain
VSSAEQPIGQPPAAQAGRPPAVKADRPPAGQAAPASIAARAASAPVTAGMPKKPDLYRSPVAPLVWWVWVIFALGNLGDLAVQGRSHFAAEVAAILVLITGVAYVAAFRPRVVADDAGVTINNPLRDHRVPWACVQKVDLADSLRVHAAPQDGEQKSKVLYAWAVHSPRRSRLKAEARARRAARTAERRSASYKRLPPEARAAMTKTDAEHIAVALDERVARARAAGAAGGRRTSRWNFPAIAALILPALLLIAVILA